MPYSETEMLQIERDPVRLKAYWWHMAQHLKRIARKDKDLSEAAICDLTSKMILENIDVLVKSSLKEPVDL